MSHRVLIVGWSGAEWSVIHPLLDTGRLPNFERLVNEGVIGRIRTLQPHVAPLVWNSIATGVRPTTHEVLGYLRRTSEGLEPAGGWQRRAAAFWEVCSAAGLRTHVINWPTYPAEPINGTFVAEAFTRFGDRSDSNYRALSRAVTPQSAAAELGGLRIDPREIGAEELLPFVPLAGGVEQERDAGLAVLANRVANAASAHAMATSVLEDDWQVAAVCCDLLDRLGHSFMRFHPPRASVTSRSFELYRGVMDAAYQFCDQMLGRLMELAGPETTVMLFSDHGFRTGGARPPRASTGRGDATWLTHTGVLAMRGPTTHRDRWVWGGGLLDLCPTLYILLGLPWEGLDGRPLWDGFASIPMRSTVSSRARESMPIAPPDDTEIAALGRHYVDDGYLEQAHFRGAEAAIMAEDACDFNAAQSYLQFGQPKEALALLEKCLTRRPEVARFAVAAAGCQMALGNLRQAQELVEQAVRCGVPAPHGALLRGQILVAEGKLNEALEQFFASEAAQPRQPGIHAQIGRVYLAQGRLDEARRAFRKELELNEESTPALAGLGQIELAAGNLEEALEYLLRAAALKEVNPEVHYWLAQTLDKLERPVEALAAVERALRQEPGLEGAAELRERLLA